MHDPDPPVEGNPGPADQSVVHHETASLTPAEALMDAALALSPGGLLFARRPEAELRLHARDPRRFIIGTAWHEFSGDLSKGLVLQAMCDAAGRPGAPICHSGNILEFRHRGRSVFLDVEDHIADWGIRRLPGCAVLFHESCFDGPRGVLGKVGRLARIRYEYAIPADSPVLRLTVTLLPEPGVSLEAPRITTALDAMSPEGGHAITRAMVWGPGGRFAAAPRKAGAIADLLEGGASHIELPEETPDGAGGAGGATHLRLLDGARLCGVKATRRADGAMHWAVLRYGQPRLAGGTAMVIREERLRMPPGQVDPLGDEASHAIAAAQIAASDAAAQVAAIDAETRERELAMQRLIEGESATRASELARVADDMDRLIAAATPGADEWHEDRVLRTNVKLLASDLARRSFPTGTAASEALLRAGPRRVGLGSRICCQADMEGDWVRHWCAVLGMAPAFHRKVWEDCFAPQALWEAGMLVPGHRGLGFAVGREPLPAVFAARGVEVLATDLDPADERARAWLDTDQHATRMDVTTGDAPSDVPAAHGRIRFRPVDMTCIPDDLLRREFDFIWSICALEHLGSLEAGEDFVRTAMRCLRPGGIAVHTTEYNVDPDGETLEAGGTVFYQRRHLDRLARSLAAEGHEMLPIQDAPGAPKLFDRLVDLPPYPHQGGPADTPHLRLALAGHTVTSAGIIVRAGA